MSKVQLVYNEKWKDMANCLILSISTKKFCNVYLITYDNKLIVEIIRLSLYLNFSILVCQIILGDV